MDLQLNLRTSILSRAQILFGIAGPGMESQKTTISFGGQTTDRYIFVQTSAPGCQAPSCLQTGGVISNLCYWGLSGTPGYQMLAI